MSAACACLGNVGGIGESAGLDLWRLGVLAGVKQGERVGDCKGMERGVDAALAQCVGLPAWWPTGGEN